MTTEDPLALFARDTAAAFVDIPSHFMIDGATYAHGGKLGFEGMDFYVAGRGGPLGEVSGYVVAAVFFFFNPALITEAWERSAAVLPRTEAGREFASVSHRWAEEHLPVDVDYARLSALLAPVIGQANPAGAPLFAAWRELPEPEPPRSLALHRLNVLRELRGAYHESAVMAAGILPRDAVASHHPFMLLIYGWPPVADGEVLPAEERDDADRLTDRLFGRAFSVLNDSERSELRALLESLTVS